MPGSAIDPLFVRANLVEAALWAAMAVVVLVRWRRPAGIVLAGALLAFGLSDVVETRTGRGGFWPGRASRCWRS